MKLQLEFAGLALSGICALALGAPASAKPIILTSQTGPHSVSAGLGAPISTAGAGWQGSTVYNVPTGITDLFFHDPCPLDGPKTPVSGSFVANAQAKPGLTLEGNFRRDDVPNEWGWVIDWPGGAPAASQITFNVYCKKR